MMRYGVVVLVLLVVFIAVDELHARFRNRRQLERLAKGIEAMRRAAALERIGYRPPTSTEAALGDLHELFEAAERELHEEGLTVFGDLAEERPGGGITGITRWFVDPTGTVTGWFGVVRTQETGAKHPTMMLFSESESGQFFITGRGAADRFLARAPAIHRAVYPWDQGLAQVLESHLASTEQARGATGGALRRVDGINAATAVLERLRSTSVRWRASQSPDRLLEEDVRSVLRERFEELDGASLIKLMMSRS